MGGTSDILSRMKKMAGVRYPVLVPNMRGLSMLLELLERHNSSGESPPTDEIAIFVAASESFSRANINCSVAESLERVAPVVDTALSRGLRVRGYVSTVITCPYEGPISPTAVRDVSKSLIGMGCYEVSLGDTTGQGTPVTMTQMLDKVLSVVRPDQLAVCIIPRNPRWIWMN
jgi:hydroxymethylglutaryl-CoA lyase